MILRKDCKEFLALFACFKSRYDGLLFSVFTVAIFLPFIRLRGFSLTRLCCFKIQALEFSQNSLMSMNSIERFFYGF